MPKSQNVSLTKNGYFKLKDLIAKYPSNEILAHLDEIKLNRMQALKMLAGNERTGTIPDVWDKVKKCSLREQHALLLISIICSHEDLIELFQRAANISMKGTISRGLLETKAYTNLAYAMDQLGIAVEFRKGANSVSFDWTPVFQNMKIGSLVKELIYYQLRRRGWRELGETPFGDEFYKQCIESRFNKIFGLPPQKFLDWLQGKNISRSTTKEVSLQTITPQTAILKRATSSPKNFKGFFKAFADSLNDAALKISTNLQARFVAALLTKPFVILTGLTGSGKTKLAQAFAYWISENSTQVCMVPVGSDWTNREPLLGYPNALDIGTYIKPDNGVLGIILEAGKPENTAKPYFLILDEMNLSHVERYFADFLSSMESKEPIPLHTGKENWKDEVPSNVLLPTNLFIVGTVNIDETTYMFSPKVLDRANVIEFRVTKEEMESFLRQPDKPDLSKLRSLGAEFGHAFVQKATQEIPKFRNSGPLDSIMLDFFNELKLSGVEFGYRTAAEIYRFASIMQQFSEDREIEFPFETIIDAAIMQKLLPKVHGSRRKIEPVLKTLATLCLVDKENTSSVLNNLDKADYTNPSEIKFPLSWGKIARMNKRVIQDGFTSYAEA